MSSKKVELFGSLSILLILRELLTDTKQPFRFVVVGFSRGFLMRKIITRFKGEKYRIQKNLNRLFDWRQIGSCLDTNNQKRLFAYE